MNPELLNNLSNQDKEYHTFVVEQMRAAQSVVKSWSEFLSARYKLSPNDIVDVFGNIKRIEIQKEDK